MLAAALGGEGRAADDSPDQCLIGGGEASVTSPGEPGRQGGVNSKAGGLSHTSTLSPNKLVPSWAAVGFSSSLINLAHLETLTCKTMGSCSGGFLFSTPIVSHTWKAVSCSAKKGLCCGTSRGLVRGSPSSPNSAFTRRPHHRFSRVSL